MNEVFVVTYWVDNEEPVVTVWDNEDAAMKHYKYCVDINDENHVCADRCPIYSTFMD